MKKAEFDFTALKGLVAKLISNKLLLYLLFAAAVLILLFGGSEKQSALSHADITPPVFSLEEQESRIRDALSRIDGVGSAEVVLSLRGTASRDLAKEDSEALVIAAGGGTQSAVELRYLYPEYLGAVVICDGGGNSQVRLDVTNAVSALTGLTSDRITVIKMKKA